MALFMVPSWGLARGLSLGSLGGANAAVLPGGQNRDLGGAKTDVARAFRVVVFLFEIEKLKTTKQI